MLKGIPPIISPELMHVLMSMGHGDAIVLADGNFPAASNAQRLVRMDGHGVSEVLEAIMPMFPLDTYTSQPTAVMEVLPDDNVEPVIWEEYERILGERQGESVELSKIERHEFYSLARDAFAVVATSETALYANLLLVKGVVT
ncbi:MAG: RbsD/FucU family protein [Planctomycetota bacterium]